MITVELARDDAADLVASTVILPVRFLQRYSNVRLT
jgi:hypothetical protein